MAKIRVRARTVDMLGRQQIAGIPTAISELFKNAHDAYANRVEVDFYRSDDLFVLRDDGMGMSREEFEQRWLTLGTDSKLSEKGGLTLPPKDPRQRKREILGEKGIGRLAVAAIGDQLLVLTRPKQPNGSLTVAFINWKLFALPGLDLSEIEIPIREFAPGELPGENDIQGMVQEVRDGLKGAQKRKKMTASQVSPIFDALDNFSVDPAACDEFLPKGLRLSGTGHGTHFYIQPADPMLALDLEESSSDDASPLVKMLIGFTNTMLEDRKPPIVASFREHQEDGVQNDVISDSEFFTPTDFKMADHHFSGTFDEHGQFTGQVQIYGKKPKKYVSSWPNPGGEVTKCGPFGIDVAYIPGRHTESRLPPEEFARLAAKLQRIGGLYIYRDGIRVLPYGDADYDFLGIEKRRTKSAAYYFFSHRRMLGCIHVTRRGNGELQEKAGREGFRQNKAYRQFKAILEHFFLQLAADFFREGGLHADMWQAEKEELNRANELKRKREKEAKARRQVFQEELDAFFERNANGELARDVAEIIEETDKEAKRLFRMKSSHAMTAAATEIESRAREQLSQLQASYRITKPRGWGLTKALRRDWEAYKSEAAILDAEVVEPAVQHLDDLVAKLSEKGGGAVDRQLVLAASIDAAKQRADQSLKALDKQIREEVKHLQQRVLQRSKQCLTSVRATLDDVLVELNSTDFSSMDKRTIERRRNRWEANIEKASEEAAVELTSLRDQAARTGTDEGFEDVELTAAMEEELSEHREQSLEQLELVQVGMALGVIQHEFSGCVKSLRNSLRSLKRWSDKNKPLQDLYHDIRANFDHLDGYLTLFTPLTRRLYRTKVDIRGGEIAGFLEDLFQDRFERHGITFEATKGFRAKTIVGYPSSFYPCFVNLVDNAAFWLSERRGPREILLDVEGDAFVVSDSGPGIPARDEQRIFEMGFTRKPHGQGLGLYVCRATLEKAGYEIYLEPYEKGRGAKFLIRPAPND